MLSYVSIEEWTATSWIARRHASFEWTIGNFSHFSTKGYRKIASPSFTCFVTEWQLELFPNGENVAQEGKVRIFLCKLSPETKVNCEYKISLKGENGVHRCMRDFENVFEAASNSWGLTLLDLETLVGVKSAELLPNDVLTVYCEINCMDDIIHGEVERASQQTAYEGNYTATNSIPNAIKTLTKDLETLLKEQKDCDVTLQVGEEKFHAHKLLLGARSTVFAAMFEHDMKESQSNVVTITDMEPAVMAYLLRYIYAGYVGDMSVEMATALYVAADKYALSELKSQCADFLQKNLTVGNACDVAILADSYNDGMIIDSLKMFVSKTINLLSTEKWKRLVEENPRLAYEITLALILELSSK